MLGKAAPLQCHTSHVNKRESNNVCYKGKYSTNVFLGFQSQA